MKEDTGLRLTELRNAHEAAPEKAESDQGLAVLLEGQAAELVELKSELKEALSTEKRIRQRLMSVLDAIDAGVLVVSEDGRIETVNHAVTGLIGHADDELLGQPLEPLLQELDDEHQPLLVERRGFEQSESGEVVLLNAITVFNSALERQEKIGQLSDLFETLSKLCHNINNPLTALMGRAQLLGLRKDLDPKLTQTVESLGDAANCIAVLVKDLGTAVQEGRDNTLASLLEVDAD
jgi:nitrogen-specific signal transduction histidine kinase